MRAPLVFRPRLPAVLCIVAASLVSAPSYSQSINLPTGKQILNPVPGQPQRLNSLPMAMATSPDGRYIVFKYSSVFANKASATETVTPMLEADGTWHVSGYYVR